MKKYLIFSILMTSIGFTAICQTDEDIVNQNLNQAYLELSSEGMYAKINWGIGECASDNSEVGGESIIDYPDLQSLGKMLATPSNIVLSAYWFRAYNIIYHCNYVIMLAPTLTISASSKNQYIAEAKFVRSLMFFELTKAFGSIPLYKDTTNWKLSGSYLDYDPNNKILIPKDSISEVYMQIENDLNDAINYLPEKSTLDADNKFRATKGAAEALLAKAYLFESSYAKNYPIDSRFAGLTEKWSKALQFADTVINSNHYKLIGIDSAMYQTWWDSTYLFPGKTPGFRYIFTVAGNDCDESVFEVRDLTTKTGWSPNGGNVSTVYNSCRKYFNSDSISTDLGGWGFNCPTAYLVNAFGNKDSKETSLNSDSTNEINDPRFAVTIAKEKDSALIGGTDGDKWYTFDFENSPTKMSNRKFECSPEEYWSNYTWFGEGPLNVHVIRYADVVLMASEAAFMKGDNTKALDYINLIRKRARLSGTTGFPKDLTSVSFEDIVHERRLELACEGHRFFDLVRWNLAVKFLNRKLTDSTQVVFASPQNDFFPIPETGMGSSVKNITGNNFYISPNPALNILKINTDLKNLTVSIFNMEGKLVLKRISCSNNFTLDISQLSKGFYMVKIENNEKVFMNKFVKE